jgi:hypothetical protein
MDPGLKPLNRFQPNLPEMFIGWSSTRFVFGADLKSSMAARVHNVFSLPSHDKNSHGLWPGELKNINFVISQHFNIKQKKLYTNYM